MASRLLLLCVFAGVFAAPGQLPPASPLPTEPGDIKLPGGKSQREEMLKEEHRKSVEEAGKLIKLSEELKADLEKNDRYVVSVANLDRLEEIEKLAKRIRGRLKRY